ncbi:unnamed protein product [Rotaria magnacalcarata]|nr:unnamed protein product [Rotaria magnacalcarata]
MIIVADIEKTTTIVEMFFCRLWFTWIKFKTFNLTQTGKNNKSRYFITQPAFLSIEINAHNSLYLILLVKQKQLLPQALNIPIFNSQACESIFRNTRALNGIYSTIFNFTVHDFLRRAQRLSLLNDIKCKQLHNGLVDKLVFPVHYKHRVERQSPFTHSQLKIDEIDIEQVITDAYHHAVDMLEDDEVFESDDDNDEDEDDTTNDLSMNEDNNDSSINKDYTDEDEQNSIQDLLNTTKKDFSGVNTADKVEPHI